MNVVPVAMQNAEFTTIDASAVPAARRFPFWSDVICKNFSPAENHTDLPEHEFCASLRGRSLGRVGVCSIKGTSMVSRRTQQSLRRDPLDHFFVSLLSSGTALISQNGRNMVQGPGDIVMYNSGQTFNYEMDSVYEGIWLRLPRQAVTTRMVNPESLTARPLSAACSVGRLLGMTITEASNLDLQGNSIAATRVASSMVDLLSAAFEAEYGTVRDGNSRHVNLLDTAKSYILANLEDPDLNTDALVQVLGVSRRTLNRLFAGHASTPIRWLWHQRLLRSKEMLENGHETRVTDVALGCGFSDFSHFSRAFKAEFGVSPKAVLSRSQ